MRRVALTLASAALVFSPTLAPTNKQPGDEVANNEASTVGSLRSLNTAEAYYARTYSEIGFTCTLQDFSPPAAGEKPSAKAADLIDRTVFEQDCFHLFGQGCHVFDCSTPIE